MNMGFSGVAGSRPAREVCLADGNGERTVKGAAGHFRANSIT
jgi:hypothetical protein